MWHFIVQIPTYFGSVRLTVVYFIKEESIWTVCHSWHLEYKMVGSFFKKNSKISIFSKCVFQVLQCKNKNCVFLWGWLHSSIRVQSGGKWQTLSSFVCICPSLVYCSQDSVIHNSKILNNLNLYMGGFAQFWLNRFKRGQKGLNQLQISLDTD